MSSSFSPASALSTAFTAAPSPIAIIGLGCRFPKAANLAEYWRMLMNGIDGISDVPSTRWNADAFYDPRPATPCKIVTRRGGFLDDIALFDPYFFGISPREAVRMDPQQRLLLEVTWEAMESAGIPRDRFSGSRTGVFVGVCTDDYITIERGDVKNIDIYMGTGGSRGSTAGRLAFVYGLTGPIAAIDTACSSSLVAVHHACNSLLHGDCDMAVAGGVNVILHPGTAIAFSQANLLSPDGRCKAFDARANGFVRSEGAGVILLKPLDRALHDGDPVYAVIRATASNNDGSSSPFMTPSREGQATLLRHAYERAGVEPSSVQYVEAHGTGTEVGDPIEVGAISDVLGAGRAPDQFCALGSSKTNIGHTEAAAGIAGLIKAALCLHNKTIPPNLHFSKPNPNIPWETLPFTVPTVALPWPVSDGPARAGVNSFGISGTNAHAVLEEAPASAGAMRAAPGFSAPPTSAELFTLSAHTADSLREMAVKYRDMLRNDHDRPDLHDTCYSAAVRRTHHEWRVAAVAHSRDELLHQLDSFVEGDAPTGLFSGLAPSGTTARPVFVFSGIGTQWAEMGRQLREHEPVFRDKLVECDSIIRGITGWSVLQEIDRPAVESRLDRIDVMQPAIFSVQVSLAELWRSWGIHPSAIVGHSLGEIAAAHVAGVLSVQDAALAACERSRLMNRKTGMGRMAAVGLSAEDTARRLQPFGERISIATVNSSRSCAVTGDADVIEKFAHALDGEGIFSRVLAVDVACHSRQMQPLQEELAERLGGIATHDATVPLYSTVFGRRVDGSELSAEYWARNLRETVRFADAIDALLADAIDGSKPHVFLEISPGTALVSPLRQIGQDHDLPVVALASMRANSHERDTLLEVVGALFTHGCEIDWKRIYPTGRFVPPPQYVWQRERFWFDDGDDNTSWMTGGSAMRAYQIEHPLLALHWESADDPATHHFDAEIDLRTMPAYHDHSVEGMPLLPAAAYIEMALAASLELFGPGPRKISGVELTRALFLSAEHPTRLQLVMKSDAGNGRRVASALTGSSGSSVHFQFFERQTAPTSSGTELDSDASASGSGWSPVASGQVEILADEAELPHSSDAVFSQASLDSAFDVRKTGDQFYASITSGMTFGPSFRAVQRSWEESKRGVTLIELPEVVTANARLYSVHPVLLDACFHSLNASSPEKKKRLALPFAVDRVDVLALPDPSQRFWCEVVLNPTVIGYSAAIRLFDQNGRCLIRVEGYRAKLIEPHANQSEAVNDWLYETPWREVTTSAAVTAAQGDWLIVGGGEGTCATLHSELAARGVGCLVLPPNTSRAQLSSTLQKMQLNGECAGIVHLGALDNPPTCTSAAAVISLGSATTCRATLELLQSAAEIEWRRFPRVFLVTRNARATAHDSDSVPLSIAQASLAGLARVAATELPELGVTQIDIENDTSAKLLADELLNADGEPEVALRSGRRYAPRLERLDTNDRATRRRISISGDGIQSYQLESSTSGLLDDLKLRDAVRRPPARGEIEIRVAAVGLNFLDVLKALNMAPGLPDGPRLFGMECAGKVVATGEGVESFCVGDEVIALDATSTGCFRAFLTTSADAVFRKPRTLTFEQGATTPIAYQTAYYALCELGRACAGESVLIHSAAGGVGMAALEIARQQGLVIFATAGTEEKREYLRNLGVQHVMSSRTLDFVREIMETTSGRGVDLVLNSLAGEAIPASLSILATGGRFLEIGKRDIYADSQIGLLPFQKNLSFFAIDLLRMRREKPQVVERLTHEVARRISNGSFPALPVTRFRASQAADAFRYMAQGNHVGKIVIALDEDELEAEHVPQQVRIRDDATYLITGGLGALGLAFARHLVDKGARHVALLGRHAPSAIAQCAIDEIRALGAEVTVAAADVSDARQLASALEDVRRSDVPIRGVLHAAGITRDRTLPKIAWESFDEVFAPKVAGGWNVHEQTLRDPLDFFVLFSSAASILGGSGQANYAAANAFLDGLAHYRRRIALPALSINWGPWADIGMAAREDIRGARLAARGMGSIPVREGVDLLEPLLMQRPAQIAVMPITWTLLAENSPESLKSTFLSAVIGESAAGRALQSSGNSVAQQLIACASRESAAALLQSHLGQIVARILRIPAERIDPQISLVRFGLDSLMAVELKSKLELDFGTHFPAARLLQGPTINELVESIATAVRTQTEQSQAETASKFVETTALADEEMASILDEILAHDGRTDAGV